MRLRPFLVLLPLLAAGLAYAQAYKWVDEDGVVHFSDRPQPGAERLELPRSSAPRPTLPNSRTPTALADPAGEADEPFSYESLAISSPGPEETLWNIEGILNVTLAVQPGLQPGHRVRVYFDGENREVRGTSFQIEEVWRGVHNIQAEIVDQAGELMIRSRTNRFYVQQNVIRRGPAPR